MIAWVPKDDGFEFYLNRKKITKEEAEQHFDFKLDVGVIS